LGTVRAVPYIPCKRCDSLLDVGGRIVDGCQHKFNAEGGGRGLRRTQIELIVGGRLRIDHERSAREVWRELLQHSEPLAGDAGLEKQKARDIAAGPRQTGDEARADRVGHACEHDRDHAGLSLQRPLPVMRC
jgi:hypothetical protein